MREPPRKIAIVGTCGAGKTTLAESLQRLGFNAKQVAQEHSYVPDMWELISQPDFLIYLEVSFDVSTSRKHFHWTFEEFAEQVHRLSHARRHCHLLIDTTHLSPDKILKAALDHLSIGHDSRQDV